MLTTFAFVGLGNPGSEYEETRHNVGFKVVEQLQIKLGLEPFSLWKKEIAFSHGQLNGIKIFVLKPMTYMNNSGEILKKFASFHGFGVDEIMVIFDDISLNFGKLRIKKDGSAGGHNGMKSVIEHFGSQSINRLKIGVGPIAYGCELKDFVLSKFSKEEKLKLPEILKRSADACICRLNEGIENAMNRYNR